ncbi:ubiquinol oxidase subunit II [Lichenicoccus roseus]|uniref:Ubiquinol oxidase subunit 2 n=1 Tax=Lichenicoccus roseus TaxID=2683649 RepID=A0A5R9J849_9PROT|nr:ubiquinol oxidase subunit II [Lichenicoccus roseus]TLU73790.1 ubiquinol oxidase subunit II [Lichenicoccus roseus]
MKNRISRWLPGAGAFGAAFLLGGCQLDVLDPMGNIGQQEKSLIILSTWLMLIVVVPVISLTLLFAWRYRATNTQATYSPNWAHSRPVETVVWAVPIAIIAVLAVITWQTTHSLDPYKPLTSSRKPVVIDVVALDWKWMFIYPEQGIATVNEIAFPIGTPIEFHITSDSVMNSFFIPRLGSQIYAMAGMETGLHLIADKPGRYFGESAQFSGAGFSDMHFNAIATTDAGFKGWVDQVRHSGRNLTNANYSAVAAPSEKVPATYFAQVQPGMFDQIIAKYRGKAMHFNSGMKAE